MHFKGFQALRSFRYTRPMGALITCRLHILGNIHLTLLFNMDLFITALVGPSQFFSIILLVSSFVSIFNPLLLHGSLKKFLINAVSISWIYRSILLSNILKRDCFWRFMRPMRDLVLVKSFVEGGHHVDNINHVEVDHGKGSGKNGLIRFFTFLLKHYKNCTVTFFNEKCLWQLFLANWLLPVFDALSVSFAYDRDSISFFYC